MGTQITNISLFGRLGNAIKGVAVGLVMVVVAFVVLFWNEGRAVHRARALETGAAKVVSVKPDKVDPANEGKLVHLYGPAKTEDIVRDSVFGVTEAGILKLARKVDMYQWAEKKTTSSKKKLGGGEEVTTTYTYELKWSDKPIDSGKFQEQNPARVNPPMRYRSETFTAENVTLGDFLLSAGLLAEVNNFTPMAADKASVAGAAGPLTTQSDQVYFGADPSSPQLGDTRVSFAAVRPGVLSVVARQVGKTFEPFTTPDGDVQLLEVGTFSADQMFAMAAAANRQLTWLLRLGGAILMLIGFMMILSPLRVAADIVPIIGSILGVGLFVAAAVVAAVLSLLTIAVAWLTYRPVLGIGLIALAVGVVVLATVSVKRKKAAAVAQPAQPA